MSTAFTNFDNRAMKHNDASINKSIKKKRDFPTKHKQCKFTDYAWLNEDEALTFILQRAIERGWKLFGYLYVAKYKYYVFGGEISIYHYPDGSHEQNVIATYTVEELVADEKFMEAYYGSGKYNATRTLTHTDEHQIVPATIHHFIQLPYIMHMEEIQLWEDKVMYLFANINM